MDTPGILSASVEGIGTDLFIIAGLGMALWVATYVVRIMWFIVCVFMASDGKHVR